MNPAVGVSAEQLIEGVESCLRGYVQQRGLPAGLVEAVLYAGLGPGKRVRPTLVVRSFEAVAGPLADLTAAAGLLSSATAIEMVHAFSLVHDDLPAMDDDDVRRGRPTLHKYAGEAMAVLAGDALLGLSCELIAVCGAEPSLVVRLLRELSTATNDMIAGQVFDTFPQASEEGDIDLSDMDRLVRTHRHKTGALLRCSARMGGLCAGADADQLDALTRYADAVGLMFQVVDDLLDETSDVEQIGKATGKDAAAGKLTYPGLMGIDGARGEVKRLQGLAREALAPLGDQANPLRKLADGLAVRRK